jgi:hypothetical protein
MNGIYFVFLFYCQESFTHWLEFHWKLLGFLLVLGEERKRFGNSAGEKVREASGLDIWRGNLMDLKLIYF